MLRPRTEGAAPASAARHARLPATGGFGLGDAVVLGLSGSGPAQTLAVSIASLVAACQYGGALAVLVCFVPMLGIALGYQRLNRWDPNAGATYAWVARTFHPYLGFLAGWMILLYYTLGTSSLTIPAGTYTLELLAPTLVDRPLAVALTGGAWNVVVTLLALKGLKVAARFEWPIVLFQYAVLLTAAVAGLVALAHGTAAARFSWQWFTPAGFGGMRGLTAGILIACFMYSGWDAAIYINEESTDGSNAPGRAAIMSVVILAACYLVCVLGFQAALPPAALQAHAGNALAVIGPALLGKPWGTLMSLAVLTGTLATLQAAIISAARVGFAMARDRVMPPVFLRIDAASGNPWAATVVMSLLNVMLLALALTASDIGLALANVVSSLGLIALAFYALTGAAAVWQARRHLFRSARDLLLGGLLPGAGAAFMAWVAIEAVRTGATTPTVLLFGAGSVAVGALVAVLLHLSGRAAFFAAASAHSHSEGNLP
ncbi:MAG: APC family permease [Gammaproteobacteria bacterium]|nr:APC family permease [Gammaproteobacteria bacterium]MBV8306332.1 APC family permease [Gammaproteobacteria bacterium]MBV8402571.1 APC family permease [Gammaproteobacteria bacterium]